MRLYYQIFVSSRAATIFRQRGADDRFSSSALLRSDHQKRWSAPRSSEAATKAAPHYRDTAVCGEAAIYVALTSARNSVSTTAIIPLTQPVYANGGWVQGGK